ncbi:arginine--tRNA ligase [Roseomonas stagni]|uniref:Arginine--tRNA ligase n=1 Tax=Falsiroseomonas algicola TaxID=2716930 RepID=A0A6M1LNR7_9PROT|nr:arginine--tRNA ligase [Falsiroseomonas algicola]NGM21996.1 arginine--tRNA ligase [Falsiroseomonas algicola]
MTPTHDLFAAMRAHVVEALSALLPELPPENFARVLVEPPRDAAHGDMATNAAMVVAKAAKVPPPKLAASLCEKLAALPVVVSATPAGPGFVNIKLTEDFTRSVVPAVLAAGPAYGDGPKREGGPVNVEYVSANPTGPMHVGHCRGAVVGDALALLLRKAGFDVTREYYVNDAGAQVLALAYAAYWRYLQALGTTMTEEDYAAATPSGLQYRGDYLVPVGVALRQIFKDTLSGPGATPADPSLWLDTVRDFTVEAMMSAIRDDLAALGVQHDVFISERQVVAEGWLEKAEAALTAKELIYTGVLEPPKGKTPDDWEPRPQVLFRATQFGDDVDRPLRKSDGSGTYFANDVANHLAKIERGFPQLVQVWGADHGGYVKRMQAAVAALSDRKVSLDVVLTQIVHVMKNGEPVRMSKRAGTYITLRDLIDEVGKDAVRFTMLTRKADAQMEFDLDKVVEQSRDNPVFYVQYAHARCRSVLRQAGDPALAGLAEAPLTALTDPAELALIRRMAGWPRTVEAAAAAREPHRIAFFLQDLASDFHVLWNRGRDDSTLRFIRAEEPEATRARLALVAATATILRSGLAVMGVEPVEEMR